MVLSTDKIQFDLLSSDPGAPVDGDVWYNQTEGTHKVRSGGTTKRLSDKPYEYVAELNSTAVSTATWTVIGTGTPQQRLHEYTPAAGTYLCILTATTAGGEAENDIETGVGIRKGTSGAPLDESRSDGRRGSGGSQGHYYSSHMVFAHITVNGSEKIQAVVSKVAGTGTSYARATDLVLLKIA